MATDKAAAREAAERIEKGIDLYAAGDLAGSRRELEEALRIDPAQRRAEDCLAWVRDVLEGKRSLQPKKELDEDALRAVNEALLDDDEPPGTARLPELASAPPPAGAATTTLSGRPPLNEAPTKPGLQPLPLHAIDPTHGPPRLVTPPPPEKTLDHQWDPVPLTPAGQERSPAVLSSAPPYSDQDSEERPRRARRPTSSTLHGMPPASFDRPRLTPTPRPAPPVEEQPESVTREWSATPTGANLPPLDVPELTEEQVAELLALDTPLLAGSARNTTIDSEPHLLELEAEPTPQPHRSPLARDNTSPSLSLPPTPAASEFDAFEQTPTRDRSSQLRMIGTSETLTDLQLPPLESPGEPQPEDTGSGGNPTNPFIKSNQLKYSGTQPRVDDLPLPPAPSTPEPSSPRVATPGVTLVIEALNQHDGARALAVSEELVGEAGGIGAEACRSLHPLLTHVYQAVLGDLDRVATHGKVTPDLDPRSAFLLSRLDGTLTVEDLIDVSGMSRIEAMRILAVLVTRGVVVFT